MKLKLKIKKKAKPVEPPPKKKGPTPEKTFEDFPNRVIVRQENQPRCVKTYNVFWMEVFSSFDEGEADAARAVLHSIPLSVYMLLDKEIGDKMVMTSETYYSQARHALHDAGITPWGVEDES